MIQPRPESYRLLRDAALAISGNQLDEESLDQAIFDGGSDVGSPESNTDDLLLLVISNFCNRSGPIPTPQQMRVLFLPVFQQLTKGGSLWHIEKTSFYEKIIAVAKSLQEHGWDFVQNRDNVYLNALECYKTHQTILQGGKPIVDLTEATWAFMELLCSKYCGHAQVYSDNLALLGSASTLERFKEALLELINLPNWGVALAANFLKDSQILRLKSLPEDARVDSAYSIYVKPDVHIMRIMGSVTERYPRFTGGLGRYQGQPSEPWAIDYLDFPSPNALPFWKCIQDINHWATQAGVTAVEIDRLLYMCASGNFPEINNDFTMQNQADRYETLFRYLDSDSEQ